LATKEREFRELILRAYKGEALEGDAFFHGKRAGRLDSYRADQPTSSDVCFIEEVVTEMRKAWRHAPWNVLAFEFEMGLFFPAALDEAKTKGIELVPRYNPRRGIRQARRSLAGKSFFHDVSFVEATPRYAKGAFRARDKLTLQIELTEFSVYYTQGAMEAAIRGIKGRQERCSVRGREAGEDFQGQRRCGQAGNAYEALDRLGGLLGDRFSTMSHGRKIIRVPVNAWHRWCACLDSSQARRKSPLEFEDRWTGGYIFENEWQSFRTTQGP